MAISPIVFYGLKNIIRLAQVQIQIHCSGTSSDENLLLYLVISWEITFYTKYDRDAVVQV